ncbi:MAG: hypothetical protein U9Q84_05215 [Thermodesulfobacteriota bacterium]|nr:hypothetical protein [Thermodesulfobacteriota bacterium]
MKLKSLILSACVSLIPFSSAFAGKKVLDSGDTAWIIVASW